MNAETANQIQQLESKVRRRDELIKALREALRKTNDALADAGSDYDEQTDDESQSALPEPIFFDVYRCTECCFEVIDGQCQACGLMYQWDPDDQYELSLSVNTDTQAIHPDRSLVPRGDTPLLELGYWSEPPPEYSHSESRRNEYEQLLQRGATRLMCITFHLEFTNEGGIYAWADPDIYHDFAGPLMQVGDYWKIHLGRRITLDEDDLDGSMFVEGLLEDALFFPVREEWSEREFEKWETKEETGGIWVTRLKAHRYYDDLESASGDTCSDSEGSDADDKARLWENDARVVDEALENPSEIFMSATSNRYSTSDDDESEGSDLENTEASEAVEVEEEEDEESDEYDETYSDLDEEMAEAELCNWGAVPDSVWVGNEEVDELEDALE